MSDIQIKICGVKNKEIAQHAIDAGADILVVGRPITNAKDPAKAAENIYSEIT